MLKLSVHFIVKLGNFPPVFDECQLLSMYGLFFNLCVVNFASFTSAKLGKPGGNCSHFSLLYM